MGPLAATAFLIGLAGGVHCVAMCGGIVMALNLRAQGDPVSRSHALLRQLGYSLGRVAAYACAGALAGGVGGLALFYNGVLPGQLVLLVVANGIVILLGLHLAGLGTSVLFLERVGGVVWRGIRRLGARLAPADTELQAVGVGLAWGCIPCGLVYSALAIALVSGSALRGALVMAAFGLGTVPNLLAAGLAAQTLRALLRRPRIRLAAGIAVVALGILGMARIPGLSAHIKQGLHSLH